MASKIQLFDTHAHLDDKALIGDLTGVLARAEAAGLVGIATIGCDYRSSLFSLHLAEKYPQIQAVVGVHPCDAGGFGTKELEALAELAKEPAAKAIGEIGLDYHWDTVPREQQRQALILQIHLAKSLQKPIIIHDREAHGDLFNILRTEKAGEFGGIMHCFSGSWELAKEAMKLGFLISVGGPVTYKNAKNLPEVVKNVPMEQLLIETDCPYLTPHPYRGKVNEPANVYFVAEKIAELRHISIEEVAKKTTENALRFYGVSAGC